MFTGIVQSIGRIVAAAPRADGLRLAVDVGALDSGEIRVGDSIAVAGCCLTVVEKTGQQLSFDVSAETLACTARLDRPGRVNLELSLRLSDRLGGHLVSGHVDGVGVVARVDAVGDGSTRLDVDAPAALARFIAPKGSIAIDGVSLTVNDVTGPRFAVNLIPHTLAVTTLGELAPGARVNLEVDVIARYVARLQETP
ncbi:MAG: riboflavin synthase [Betaproteobacteria bacterium]|nr:MAG: riboflavin synthase [Betaproteobacteria bacterium]